MAYCDKKDFGCSYKTELVKHYSVAVLLYDAVICQLVQKQEKSRH